MAKHRTIFTDTHDPQTKESFAAAALRVLSRPDPIPVFELAAMPQVSRARYDDARRRWHGELEYIEISMTAVPLADLRLLIKYNPYNPRPRRGMWIDGPSTTGKTALARYVAYQLYRERTKNGRDLRTASGDERVPVMWIDVDGVATLKSLAELMCEYLNAEKTAVLTKGRGEPGYRLVNEAKKWATRCETELIVFDDVHHLNNSSAQHDNLGDLLKNLATVLPATILMIGADLEKRTGLLNEGVAPSYAQTPSTKRNGGALLYPLPYSSKQDMEEWRKVLKGFERRLVLGRDVRGMLTDHADQLWEWTGGYMGGLQTLVSFAANIAIDENDDQITLDVLARAPRDLATQRGWR
ncbi:MULTISPECIES: AAA family ATPase [unclassified Curtobacterium]|uniref:AAA family ATPase n=1 Tax=unclassified Curtobacterium TaxID=257496 RepID=UPI000FC067C1|nr:MULTISPECIES: AAA family ATPase [unclassified Curtobacterium]ROQ05146.1 AAA domain-containing protein [Curtobacterium sp. PhB171]ROQ22347.1 AAA domain-containing protein [Curtobacterium sp. PhB170]ROS33707.1 AAA domain-containing protein [Curtobacterium sp. PhB131]ROS65026.1 AAA domain-containing protein [Curtobacterium sp. PhB141]TCL71524.1 AAA domain-containing protein [Curtobacterium sp. PhB128]